MAERLSGLYAAVAGHEVDIRPAPCAFSREAARAVVRAELAGGARFDAIVGCSDPIALGALDVLRDAGVDVPSEVAVMGYDDAMREPLLTSVRQDWNLAGAMLAEMMFETLAGRKVESRKLPVELIVRASTRP